MEHVTEKKLSQLTVVMHTAAGSMQLPAWLCSHSWPADFVDLLQSSCLCLHISNGRDWHVHSHATGSMNVFDSHPTPCRKGRL